ncbi:hypothetical protein B0H17DRAFT_422375 [Mycena rosella]|uniref:Uncharacterized protein n=1 Tax=Mycena rosella TaxID=1033263 RepID=A0AAD7GHY1_MYCRO|nr:hypothetical protein B0H17DRAFT_422375 [Mycena rosella]
MLAKIYGLVLNFVLAFSAVSAAIPTIVQPAKGSVIAPNGTFPFKYHSVGLRDVIVQFFGLALYIPSRFFEPSSSFASGFFFGRFSQPNYPGNESPHNLPPATFKMPDFSKLGGGWGVGSPATHAQFHFAIIEEYGDGVPSVGFRMSLAVNEIIYNGTHH